MRLTKGASARAAPDAPAEEAPVAVTPTEASTSVQAAAVAAGS